MPSQTVTQLGTADPGAPGPHARAIALIGEYYAAFNRGDWAGMAGLLDEEVMHDLNQGRPERGRAAFRAFLDRMDRSYAEAVDSLVVMSNADGSRAAAEYRVRGTYTARDGNLPEARGQAYELTGGAFFEIRDGRITRVTNYYNLQDWIDQVSRNEPARRVG